MTHLRTLLVTALLAAGVVALAQAAPPSPSTAPPVSRKEAAKAAGGGGRTRQVPPLPPMPSDAQCLKLPAVKPPFAFKPGEELEYAVDAMGADAGRLFMKVQQPKNGVLPIEITTQTNTLFSKVRRVSGGGTSFLDPKTLRPIRYVEDMTENEIHKRAEVSFVPAKKRVKVDWKYDNRTGHVEYRYANDALDLAGATFLIRQLPFAEKKKLCFDIYGVRRLWRMDAVVEAKEAISLPIGEFNAWHLSGSAIRLDNPYQRREIHIWISDDARRLPLVAMGVIDIGAVRATLTAYTRPGEKSARAEGSETLKW